MHRGDTACLLRIDHPDATGADCRYAVLFGLGQMPTTGVTRVRKTMKCTIQSFATLAFVICAGVAWGCGSRVVSQEAASPQPGSGPSEPVSPPPAASEPTPLSVTVTEPLPGDSSAASFESDSIDCLLISEKNAAGQAGQVKSVTTAALGERVDPVNAPHPSNESERLVFRQLYETLVTVDCKTDAWVRGWLPRGR